MLRPSRIQLLGALTALCLPAAAPAARGRDAAPGFSEQSLELPGVPAAVVPADMNGDGHEDLVILVAYTAWGDTATTERTTFDGVEGLVEVMNVVTALLDHRELRVYLADGTGHYSSRATALEVDDSIHLLAAGAASDPLIAVTDEGVAAVRYDATTAPPSLSLVPLLDSGSAFTGTGAFFADYPVLARLDGDSSPDLVLPIDTGWALFRGTADGFEAEPVSLLTPPERLDEDDDGDSDGDSDRYRRRRGERSTRPRPPARLEVADQNADGRPDLLLLDHGGPPTVYLNFGELVFGAGVALSVPGDDKDREIVHVGALDGGRGSSLVAQTEVEPPEEAGMRPWIEHAKEPDFFYAVYPLDAGLGLPTEPAWSFPAEGYTFSRSDDPDGEVDVQLPGGFQDLDGDGRLDLVAITLEFSILPMVMRVLVTQRVALTMDFHPWCQQENGSFRRVPGLDLSGRFKINLRNVQVKHLSQFAGDFDGDGRADFVQLGRGRKVTIHHGGPGCTYPVAPSATIRLDKEPKHLGLVRILDVNADSRSDLYVVHPLKKPRSGESIPMRLDLYLSEGS